MSTLNIPYNPRYIHWGGSTCSIRICYQMIPPKYVKIEQPRDAQSLIHSINPGLHYSINIT